MTTAPIRKDPCPICQEEGLDSAGDNLHIFESGVKYCIARHGTLGKINMTLNVKKEAPVKAGSKFLTGEYIDIKSRNLKKKTCEFYGYMVNKNKQCHIAQYYNASGSVAMQQLRTADKKFPVIGDTSFNKTLWGSHLFTPDERVFMTITEGQIDALSVAQAFDCKYPVTSLPNGAKSAAEVISRNKKYLSGFKYVVLAFDNDKDGIQATEECLRLLEPGKIRVARWTKKDANDLLKENDVREIQKIIYNAVEYIPEPILTGGVLLESLDNYTSKTKAWPWKSANETIQPIKIPAVYTIAARPGVGKTEFVAELMRAEIGNGGKIGVIALEQTIQQVLIKLTDTLMGSSLAQVSNRQFTPEEKEMCRIVAENLVIYDHVSYGSDLETVVQNVPYMTKSLGCELIIFDNLSYSATGLSGDERKGIDKAMIALKDSTVKYEYTLINVCHIKREDSHSFIDEDQCPVSVEHIRGSQGIEMYSDFIIGLHRDKSSEDEKTRNTLIAYVLKDRMSGQDTGKSFKMKFDAKTKRLGNASW